MTDGERRERRTTVLTDQDLDRIGAAFDKRMTGLFEVIGYDTSTAESRMEIRKDHEFVRDARKAKGILMTSVLGSIGAAIGAWVYALFKAKGTAP